MEELSAHERGRLAGLVVYRPCALPIMSYIFDKENVTGPELQKEFFYYGKGLIINLNALLGAFLIDSVYVSDRSEREWRLQDFKISEVGKKVRKILGEPSSEKPKTARETIIEKNEMLRTISSWEYLEPVLGLRCFDNEMPYKDFVNLGRMEDYRYRLRLAEKNIVGYGYDKDVQKAFLNPEIGDMIDVIYGKEILAEFKAEKFGIDIQL